MTDSLHDRIRAAIDREQGRCGGHSTGVGLRRSSPPRPAPVPTEEWGALVDGYLGGEIGSCAAQYVPTRTLRRIQADRRVLARHIPTSQGWCAGCLRAVCLDLLDLAARYNVTPEGGTE